MLMGKADGLWSPLMDRCGRDGAVILMWGRGERTRLRRYVDIGGVVWKRSHTQPA